MTDYELTTQEVEDGFSYDPEYEYRNPTDTGYVKRNRRAFRVWLTEIQQDAHREGFRIASETFISGPARQVRNSVRSDTLRQVLNSLPTLEDDARSGMIAAREVVNRMLNKDEA